MIIKSKALPKLNLNTIHSGYYRFGLKFDQTYPAEPHLRFKAKKKNPFL